MHTFGQIWPDNLGALLFSGVVIYPFKWQYTLIQPTLFLDACLRLHSKVCWSVCRSVGPHFTHIYRKVWLTACRGKVTDN